MRGGKGINGYNNRARTKNENFTTYTFTSTRVLNFSVTVTRQHHHPRLRVHECLWVHLTPGPAARRGDRASEGLERAELGRPLYRLSGIFVEVDRGRRRRPVGLPCSVPSSAPCQLLLVRCPRRRPHHWREAMSPVVALVAVMVVIHGHAPRPPSWWCRRW